MIQSIEGKSKRELVEIVKIQIAEFQKLDAQLSKVTEEREGLQNSVAAALTAFDDYSMDVEDYPPIQHVEMIDKLCSHLAKRDLETTRKGFWLGFEDARCHPEENNILMQWENTLIFNQAKTDKGE